jgi:hypothetical protein
MPSAKRNERSFGYRSHYSSHMGILPQGARRFGVRMGNDSRPPVRATRPLSPSQLAAISRRQLDNSINLSVSKPRREGLDPHGMYKGRKEGEQGFNRPSTPAAIVALIL